MGDTKTEAEQIVDMLRGEAARELEHWRKVVPEYQTRALRANEDLERALKKLVILEKAQTCAHTFEALPGGFPLFGEKCTICEWERWV